MSNPERAVAVVVLIVIALQLVELWSMKRSEKRARQALA